MSKTTTGKDGGQKMKTWIVVLERNSFIAYLTESKGFSINVADAMPFTTNEQARDYAKLNFSPWMLPRTSYREVMR